MTHEAGGRLAGKVAIITGGGQGTGRGAALCMAREGASIVVVGRTLSKLETVADEVRAAGGAALAVAGDITERTTIDHVVDEAIKAFGRIDILVNAAQSPDLRYGPLLDVTEAVMSDLWSSGPMATLAFMRACHPHMKTAGGGAIVNFGTGSQWNPKDYGVYAAAKAAVQTISRAAAMEWAPDGIRVNILVPLSASPAYDAACENDPSFAEKFTAHIPLKRMGDPERDVGEAILFLVTAAASYITGSTLMVDGGHTYLR
ncbi:SDR family NAD(P)-dependent oxidoreductase [Sphingomonas sp.]|uniref:SDR family NAD(P)-dependent oxidoreductase n=1 Tax=Sphingomonas sp. TaxID=28214 RepID=UPI003D6D683A